MKDALCKRFSMMFAMLTIMLMASIMPPFEAVGAAADFTIWPGTTVPAVVDTGPDSAVELGVKFRSDANGFITGIRFYKASTNTGTHTANLWTNTGALLATATFTSETASGWQQVTFPTPVAITANTVYVASYHTSTGHYSDNQSYFSGKGMDSPPLHALADGVTGLNGVFAYGSASSFPSQGWNGSNYWVDVVFSTTPDTTPPTVTAFTVPATATVLTVSISSFTATDDVGVAGYLVNESATAPSAAAGGWSATAPTSYTFTTAGSKTLYAWAKDAAGNVSASRSSSITVTLQAANPEPAGWYAGDMHVHRSCGGSPEAISSLYTKMSPQNLSVISLLADMGNGEVQNPATDLPLVNGQDDPVTTSGRIVHWDAEWHWDPTYTQYAHQALGGHIVALGLTEAHQAWEEYTFPIFNWAHLQNGIAGFAHMQYLDNTIPQNLTCCTPIEYPVEVALGAADFVSEDVVESNATVSGMNPEYAIQAYYRLLNCGFRPGLAAGTDYPCNEGKPLGSLLTYVQVAGGQMTYRNWIEGIAKGKTVVSRNGHNEFLKLTVNGTAAPGDEIKLTGAGIVPVTIQWTANQNLAGTIELVRNGVVVASRQASVAAEAPASLSVTVDFAKSGWLAARRMGNDGHQVHTGAVFVTVNNAPVRANVADAEFYVQWMDNLLVKTSPGGAWSSYFVSSRNEAQARYQAAKAMYQQIALEAAAQITPLSITTTSLPGGASNVSYSATLSAGGGTSPYTWSVTGGSLPAGLSLNSGTGVISGMPTAAGTFSFTVQVTDSGNPGQSAIKEVSITVAAQVTYTIWTGTIPSLVDSGPDSAVELGVKFRADSSSYITGIRFYKASTNTGTHVGNLWASNGTLLATATFSNETASGWQQVNFPAPVAITSNTVYVASYHTNTGHYSADLNYFAGKGIDSPPLHALADGVSGFNGVYAYGSTSSFPNQGWKSSNYWVDVMFSTAAPAPATLSSITVTPAGQTISTGTTRQYTATGTYSDASTQNITSQVTWASSNTSVSTINSSGLATAVNAGVTSISATLSGVAGSATLTVQAIPLTITTATLPGSTLNISYSATLAAGGGAPPYTWSVANGSLPPGLSLNSSTGGLSGTPAATGAFRFTVQVTDSGNPGQTDTRALSITSDTGGPIMIISSGSNPFSRYYAEILRNEGFNAFVVNDISSVSSTVLAYYDVVILGDMTLTSDQVTMLGNWVNAGGHLVAMRPDKKLAGLLGLTDLSSTISNAYLLVNSSSAPGAGIVNQTIQYHGTADLYALNGASSLATLYSNASTAISSPAVTLKDVGTNGGQAAAFTYDLARSVVYMRQGNPVWSGQDRDGDSVIRSNDLFYGNASFDSQPNWVDLNKVAIPQADEQQRLLANLIIRMNLNKKPLPRFWYFPRGLAAVVVMTGDDHGTNGTLGRFDSYMSISPPGCSVENWECIRSTSYVFPNNNLSESQASTYNNDHFEVALHVDTNCADWTPSSLQTFFSDQLGAWSSKYYGLPSPVTNRTHCITWSDYATQPKVELAHGIRLDTTYYFYPQSWVGDRPGFFTGSGMPMRFADSDGTLIDVYQATTQMTDESGQTYPFTIDTLLDRAIGPEGYYGAFTVNAHTDVAASSESDLVVYSTLARGIPVISAHQMLEWLDARNASTFNSLEWNGNILSFSISAAQGAHGLTALAPVAAGQTVTRITCNGSTIPFTAVTVKGMQYARFGAANGEYRVEYALDINPPAVAVVFPADGASGVSTVTNVTVAFSEAMDPATITDGTFELRDPAATPVPSMVSYNASAQTATLDPTVPLANLTNYTAAVKGGTTGVKDVAGNPLTNNFTWSFATEAVQTGPFTIWPGTTVPKVADAGPDSPVELGVKFRSDSNGSITGIRFYKSSANTGTHVGNLWTSSGTLLATATFTNETASGWQQVNFSVPVAITANTVYVASYHANSGHYSNDQNYFAGKGVDSPPLHALRDGLSGFNGVYAYGSTSSFPNQGWNSSNYWVDVVFQP